MDSSDKDLLLLAAKAAGLTLFLSSYYGRYTGEREIFRIGDSNGLPWDPLEKDGEALRLAIKLGICIQFIPECDTAQVYQERATGEPYNIHVSAIGDIELRRIIVQAAAEIGRAMQ